MDRAAARGLMVRETIKQEEGGHISAEDTARALGISKTDDWGRTLFFLNRRNSLKGKRPLDLLRQGKVSAVKRLA